MSALGPLVVRASGKWSSFRPDSRLRGRLFASSFPVDRPGVQT